MQMIVAVTFTVCSS